MKKRNLILMVFEDAITIVVIAFVLLAATGGLDSWLFQ